MGYGCDRIGVRFMVKARTVYGTDRRAIFSGLCQNFPYVHAVRFGIFSSVFLWIIYIGKYLTKKISIDYYRSSLFLYYLQYYSDRALIRLCFPASLTVNI